MYGRLPYHVRILYGVMNMSITDSRYEIRVEKTLKEAYLAAAKNNDRDGAQLIRDFMREYVRANQPKREKK